MIENKQFNRHETEHEHYYSKDYGSNCNSRDEIYSGYLKCKLVHTEQISLIIPDIIFLETETGLKWIQPLAFMANNLEKYIDEIVCFIPVDISCGVNILIEICNKDFIRSFEDSSQLFKCKISARSQLEDYCTGEAIMSNDSIPSIILYHHTKEEYKFLILESEVFKLSRWNIQGTHELKKYEYCYFSPLNSITKSGDLVEIAMSDRGKIVLITDKIQVPKVHNKQWFHDNSDNICVLPVYSDNVGNRTSIIELSIDSTLLTSQHIYRHSLPNTVVYYEICNPFIHRVGMEGTDNRLKFSGLEINRVNNLYNPSYIIIGDCLHKSGLEAPYNEENTEHIFKIHDSENENFLEFWFNNGNKDHFTGLSVDFVE